MLELCHLNFDEANLFVATHHRHHGPVVRDMFRVAAWDPSSRVVMGVALVGRPVARMLDDGWTCEVTRCCVIPDAKGLNAPSMLYGACRRAAFSQGFKRIVTYTLEEEHGTSLKASGWTLAGDAGGGSWSRDSRPRTDKHPTGPKSRWECAVSGWVSTPRPRIELDQKQMSLGLPEAG